MSDSEGPSPKLTEAMRAAKAAADEPEPTIVTAADLAASSGPSAEPAPEDTPADAAAPEGDPTDVSVTEAGPEGEASMSDDAIVALIAERDEYLDALQRLKAEFANARRRADEQAANQRQQAAADLVGRLLPVLDSAHAALDQGVEEVRPLNEALLEVLTSQGLVQLDPVGEPFDPQLHEAVMFESADDADGEQVVVETMRLGYAWNERVLRAAMVKVRG